MTFWTFHRAQCEVCGDVCEYGDTSRSGALISARQTGWQAIAREWIFDGVEVAWDFYCPTHKRDEWVKRDE